MLERRLLTADYVYNGLGRPRANGAVVLQNSDEGERVVLIDSLEVCRQNFPDASQESAGFAVSIPVVNAHTHLDLSDMPYRPGSYADFIQAVAQYRQQRGLIAAKRGVAALAAAGVQVVGDIVAREEVMRWLLISANLSGVAYWEVNAPDPSEAAQVFDDTVAKLREFRSLERPGGLRVGLAPHTPHTVSADLLKKLCALAKHNRVPLQIHVAESSEETALHLTGYSPLSHPYWQPSGLRPVQYLKLLGVLEASPTLVHMIEVTEEDVRDVQKAGCAVVHCARSSAALGCARFPWQLYARYGVSVGLGTDSLGSAPDLSVAREVAAVLKMQRVRADHGELVWAATKGGYRALGLNPPRFLRGNTLEHVTSWDV